MKNINKYLLIFVLALLVPFFWCLNIASADKPVSEEEVSIERDIPIPNFNGYLRFHEPGVDFDNVGDVSLDLYDLDRTADITLEYDYFIDSAMYESFVSTNGSERLDNINFYMTDSREGIIHYDESWSMSVDQSSLVFDEWGDGTVTIKNSDFSPYIDTTSDVYVVKILWGNSVEDMGSGNYHVEQTDSFLFGNTNQSYSYNPITLHFQPDWSFYEPEVWFNSGTDSDHNYFWAESSVIMNYDLSYGTTATDVWLEVTDFDDASHTGKYSVSEFDEGFSNGSVAWSGTSTNYGFCPGNLPDAERYIGGSKFKLVGGIDYQRVDESGNVTNTGTVDTTMSDNGAQDYLTSYFEDIFITPSFKTPYVEEGGVITMDIDYESNRSETSFYADNIDLIIDRVGDDDSIEDTLTINLVNRPIDEDSYVIGNHGSKSYGIDTNKYPDFFVKDKTYNARIHIDDLGYDRWSFARHSATSKEASFTVLEKGTVVDVTDQQLRLTYPSEVVYGEDIVIEYEFNGFTSPYLVEYKFNYGSADTGWKAVNSELTDESGLITITSEDYMDYVDEYWEGNISIDYKISNDSSQTLVLQFTSNEERVSFYHESIPIPDEDEGWEWYYYVAIAIIILIILLIVVGMFT